MSAPFWPQMMKRTTAARYCDLAPAKFLAEVAAGRLPLPVKLGGEDHWHRDAVDADLKLEMYAKERNQQKLGDAAILNWERNGR